MSGDVQVPEGWGSIELIKIGNWRGGGTPSKLNCEYWENGNVPWVSPKDIKSKWISTSENNITERAIAESSTNLSPKDSLIIVFRSGILKHSLPVAMAKKDVAINQDLKSLVVSDDYDESFMYHWFKNNENFILNNCTKIGTTVDSIEWNFFKNLICITPKLQEQTKIASILTSVDNLIENIEKQISKLQDLKKGMMTELLTKGIGHTEFKDSSIGRIPVEWNVVSYDKVVKRNMPEIKLYDNEQYSPVIVRRRHKGIEVRELKEGARILVKQQFKALPNTFLISKRQIFHGSCGIVPNNICKNAIISKEYLALNNNSNLDIRFLNYFSHTDQFHQQIIRTTYGVDVEKFVFKDILWMKEELPLPPLEEQVRICDAIDSVNTALEQKISNMNHMSALKKALMNDLLTGKKRVV